VLAAIPLVVRTDTIAPQPALSFALPAGTASAAIEYRATGHGGGPVDTGCIGPAEEFCARTHVLAIDGAQVDSFEPWIASCASMCDQSQTTWCAQNPTGNVQSVQAPRANWCPGAMTAPRVVTGALAAGDHAFAYTIDRIGQGGRWAISATAYAYGAAR